MPTSPELQPGTESSGEQLAAESACRDLINHFAYFVDNGMASRVVDLFTEDAEMGSPERSSKGREELAEVMAARQAATDRHTRHQVTNIAFRRTGPHTAQANSLLCLYVLGGPTELSVRAITVFDDEFARDTNGRWRFSSRRAQPLAGGR
jgi:ketosteroid isomerase-like protein